MSNNPGAVALAGMASVLAMSANSEAQGAACPTPYPFEAVWCVEVSTYAADCSIGGTTYGSNGICAASIQAALSAASTYLKANLTSRALVVVGAGTDATPVTYDLSHDLSSNSTSSAVPGGSPFSLSNLSPTSDDYDDVSCDNATLSTYSAYSSKGCLIVSGAGTDSTSTTINVSAAVADVTLINVSHIAFENLTFTQQDEGSMSGTIVAVGTSSVQGTSGYANMTLDVGPSFAQEQIQSPSGFASVSSIGTGTYTNGETLVVNTGTYCSTSPTVVLSIGSGQTAQPAFAGSYTSTTTISGTTTSTIYYPYSIGNVLSYGVCNGTFAPNNGGPFPVSGSSMNPMMITISPHPGPLAVYNFMINTGAPVAYARAYSLGSVPAVAQSLTGTACSHSTSLSAYCVNNQVAIMATALNPGTGWNPVQPFQMPNNANQWVITMGQKGSATSPATYLPMYVAAGGTTSGPFTNVACLKIDASEAIYVNESVSGEDVVFKNVAFLNHSRSEFRGVVGGGATAGSQTQPTYAQKIEAPTPFNNLGVQLINFALGQTSSANCLQGDSGGVQIHGVTNIGPTWGNLLVNFSAYATADDSLALFNDIGGQSVTYTLSNGTSYTAHYPPTILTDDSTIIPAGQSNSSTIANSFVRFIGGYETSAQIDSSITSSAGLGSGVVFSNGGTWSALVIDASSTALSSESGCDPLIFDGGLVPGNGCPILTTLDGSYSHTATVQSPPPFVNPP